MERGSQQCLLTSLRFKLGVHMHSDGRSCESRLSLCLSLYYADASSVSSGKQSNTVDRGCSGLVSAHGLMAITDNSSHPLQRYLR